MRADGAVIPAVKKNEILPLHQSFSEKNVEIKKYNGRIIPSSKIEKKLRIFITNHA
jgi:hypothetical protein